MKRLEISLKSEFGDTKSDIPALRDMEDQFKDFVSQALEDDPNAEIEAIFNFNGKNKMDASWLGELATFYRLARCWANNIETLDEMEMKGTKTPAKFKKYKEFRREFMARVELGDNENQRRLILRKRQDEKDPVSYTDPRVLSLDYGA